VWRSQASGYLLGLAGDYVTNSFEKNEAKRATQLKELITALGPVFIKVLITFFKELAAHFVRLLLTLVCFTRPFA
jgi:hypothetical protein